MLYTVYFYIVNIYSFFSLLFWSLYIFCRTFIFKFYFIWNSKICHPISVKGFYLMLPFTSAGLTKYFIRQMGVLWEKSHSYFSNTISHPFIGAVGARPISRLGIFHRTPYFIKPTVAQHLSMIFFQWDLGATWTMYPASCHCRFILCSPLVFFFWFSYQKLLFNSSFLICFLKFHQYLI